MPRSRCSTSPVKLGVAEEPEPAPEPEPLRPEDELIARLSGDLTLPDFETFVQEDFARDFVAEPTQEHIGLAEAISIGRGPRTVGGRRHHAGSRPWACRVPGVRRGSSFRRSRCRRARRGGSGRTYCRRSQSVRLGPDPAGGFGNHPGRPAGGDVVGRRSGLPVLHWGDRPGRPDRVLCRGADQRVSADGLVRAARRARSAGRNLRTGLRRPATGPGRDCSRPRADRRRHLCLVRVSGDAAVESVAKWTGDHPRGGLDSGSAGPGLSDGRTAAVRPAPDHHRPADRGGRLRRRQLLRRPGTWKSQAVAGAVAQQDGRGADRWASLQR